MSLYEVKVFPRRGEPFVMTYPNVQVYSDAVSGYDFAGIKIECDRSILVSPRVVSKSDFWAGD